MPTLDSDFEAITEGEETTHRERLKTKWAAIEALVGDPKRIALVAADLVAHIERQREALDGKAMVVRMSRRIAVDLHDAIVALRQDWISAANDDAEAEKDRDCVVKVVMTGSADDGPAWQRHIRNKERRQWLATRFKDSHDPFRIVIVRDMWLTGFDAPCLHTMYVDKPMQGHGLMQAIARVNRVSRDKPGGLVVDLPGPRGPAEARAGHVCREWRHRELDLRHGAGCGRPPREARRRRGDAAWPGLGEVDQRQGVGATAPDSGRSGARARTGEREGPVRPGGH
jgi:type I site-specific restriction-modification system R (restriction) subunit